LLVTADQLQDILLEGLLVLNPKHVHDLDCIIASLDRFPQLCGVVLAFQPLFLRRFFRFGLAHDISPYMLVY